MRLRILFILLLCTFLFVSCKQEAKETKKTKETLEQPKTETSSKPSKKVLSPHTSTMVMIGDAHIHIDYSSPGVRDRIIFGGF